MKTRNKVVEPIKNQLSLNLSFKEKRKCTKKLKNCISYNHGNGTHFCSYCNDGDLFVQTMDKFEGKELDNKYVGKKN